MPVHSFRAWIKTCLCRLTRLGVAQDRWAAAERRTAAVITAAATAAAQAAPPSSEHHLDLFRWTHCDTRTSRRYRRGLTSSAFFAALSVKSEKGDDTSFVHKMSSWTSHNSPQKNDLSTIFTITSFLPDLVTVTTLSPAVSLYIKKTSPFHDK